MGAKGKAKANLPRQNILVLILRRNVGSITSYCIPKPTQAHTPGEYGEHTTINFKLKFMVCSPWTPISD